MGPISNFFSFRDLEELKGVSINNRVYLLNIYIFLCFYVKNMSPIQEKLKNFYNKHAVLCFLTFFALGVLSAYLALERRSDGGYLVESEAFQENPSVDGTEKVFADLSGAVNKPGIYELESGARVGDLLALGGGPSSDASAIWVSKNLNLSKVLEDSAKIYVPFEWEFYLPESYKISKTVNKNYASSEIVGSNSESSNIAGSEVDTTDVSDGGGGDTSDSSGVGEDGKTNVNSASSSELDELPGIGPAYAEKIIANRPYENLADFESKSGLYKSTVENIKDLITF
jgi:competence protein ComEA